jgi:hypothetical protein
MAQNVKADKSTKLETSIRLVQTEYYCEFYVKFGLCASVLFYCLKKKLNLS